MAAHFNQFFTLMLGSSVNDLHSADPNNIPDFANECSGNEGDNLDNMPCLNLSNLAVSLRKILDVAKLILPETSHDHNGVSMSFIKQFIQNLLTPLRHVIQLSLNQGIVLV
jgi:hypothetical protein